MTSYIFNPNCCTAGQKVAEAGELDSTAKEMQKRISILEQRLKERG